MDKKYNVDDILSEIKRKKELERAAGKKREVYEENAHSPDGFDSFKSMRRRESISEEKDDGFKFSLDDMEPETEDTPAPDPLDFSSPHVRSITDRAKMRRDKRSEAPEGGQSLAGKFSFKFNENTRILPSFATGKELKIEEIQKLNFSAPDEYAEDYFEEDYIDTIPDSSGKDFSEYNSVLNRDDVALDIAHTKLWLFIRLSVTFVFAVIAFYFALAVRIPALPMLTFLNPEGASMQSFMIACTVITVLTALIGSSCVGGGIISLFKMRANSDTLAAFAILAAVVQCIFGILDPELFTPEQFSYYFPIAVLVMLFNALGKMSLISRIQNNFKVIGSEREKKAVLSVQSPDFCREFIDHTESYYKPTIAYSAKANFFTDFLGLSYSDKYDVGINRLVAPVCIAASIIVSISTYFLNQSMFMAVSALTAILCVSATFSATFIENVPLLKTSKKLAPFGAIVSGNKAVENFCDTKAIILNEKDLFPEGNVTFHGIKSFSDTRIDEAILDAASVLCTLDGVLAPVFLQMINNDKRLLRKVDSVVFENGMGVSAWIDSRRILIGNRKLMENHGIVLPNDSYERSENKKDFGDAIYLSNSGEVSARFLVEYKYDKELAEELDVSASMGQKLIVYTNDANITDYKIWQCYGYPRELVAVMPNSLHKEFLEMSGPREEEIAEIVYASGKVFPFVKAINACVSARASILWATIIELTQIVIGYGLVAFLSFMGGIGAFTIERLAVYQLFWFVIISIMQRVRQS